MRSSILTLTNQLEQARERLKDVEETIKKSTGRDLAQAASRQVFKRTGRHLDELDGATPPKKRISDVKGRLGDWVSEEGVPRGGRRIVTTRPFQQPWQRESRAEEGRVPARNRLDKPAVTVFSRLSGPPKEEEEKTKMSSQVLVQEQPSRNQVLAQQSKDKTCKERNRRMFGALLGTLQKFRQEESRLKEKEEKKAQVERKVEEAAEREKEEAKKQRRELFSSRRQEQLNIKHIEFKLTKLKQLGEWEANQKKLLPFIQTRAEPKIFYLPKKHNDKTRAQLEAHQLRISKAIEKKKVEIEKLIEDHVPLAEEEPSVDNETSMEVTLDTTVETEAEVSLIPEDSIKRESRDSSGSPARPADTKSSSRSRSKSRSRSVSSDSSDSSLDSSSDDEKVVKIKKEKVEADLQRNSDKENQSQDVKIKLETT